MILDIDGVLWKGNQPIGNLPKNFQRLAERGWRVVLVTNNSTGAPQAYLDKLRSFGVDLQPWQIVTSAEGAAQYLKEHFTAHLPAEAALPAVYAVGETGLFEALTGAGFPLAAEAAQAVVVGLDRQFTYQKLKQAAELIRQGALFIGTNDDATLPTPAGPVPGAGAILAAVAKAAGQQPLVIGKPGPQLYTLALHRLGSSPAQTLAVGDRLETDIAGGQRLGLRTALVLSGVTDQQAAAQWRPPPDWIAPDLGTLLEMIA